MPPGVTDYAALQADIKTYITKKTLERALKETVFMAFAQRQPLPNQNSKTCQFTRYKRLPLPQSPLTEGTPPTAHKLEVETVTAVVEQWGAVVSITDIADMTIEHPPLQQAIEVLGTQAAETFDREIQEALSAGTTVYYPGTVTARGSLTATDVMTSSLLRKVRTKLRRGGAHFFDNKKYVGIVDSSVTADIQTDAAFLAASQYSNITALYNMEIGEWMQTRFVESNLIPALSLLSGGSVADSATSGSLSASTAYDLKITGVDDTEGFESEIGAKIDHTTGAGITSVDVTVPSTTGYTYNIYIGADNGTMYLVSSGNAPGAVVNVGTVPTSGATAPATPPAGVKVHQSYFIGKNAYGVVELEGMTANFSAMISPSGPSKSDPLDQLRKVGWKAAFKAVILNNDFLVRVESASAYSV